MLTENAVVSCDGTDLIGGASLTRVHSGGLLDLGFHLPREAIGPSVRTTHVEALSRWEWGCREAVSGPRPTPPSLSSAMLYGRASGSSPSSWNQLVELLFPELSV